MEKIIEKIRLLRAKAEGTDNEHEAAAFAAKVQELLVAHNLSLADIVTDEGDEAGAIGTEEWNIKYTDPWRRAVVVAAAKLYMCDVFMHRWYDPKSGRYRWGMTFVGRAHNIAVAREMSEYLLKTTVRLAHKYSSDRVAVLGFERGCGMKLAHRMDQLRQEQTAAKAERTSGGNPLNLPALYEDEATRVREAMAKMGLGRGFGRGTRFNEHSWAGSAAAESVGLSPQLGGGKTKLLGA